MPIYEYYCHICQKRISILWRTFSMAEAGQPVCSDCKGKLLTRQYPWSKSDIKPSLNAPSSLSSFSASLVASQGIVETLSISEKADSQSPLIPQSHSLWQVREPTDNSDPTPHENTQSLLGVEGWRLLGASLRGRSHAHEGKYREDDFAMAASETGHIVVVADGAGSARLSRVGAHLAVDEVIHQLENQEEFPKNADTIKQRTQDALENTLQRLSREALRRGIPLRDLATTLLILWHKLEAGNHHVITAQIGDGAIAAWSPTQGIIPLARPDHGQFAGETQFLISVSPTDIANKIHIESARVPSDTQIFLVMTDGVADDFFPPDRMLSKIVKALPPVLDTNNSDAEEQLLDLINYKNKRGSFDDRTLVVLAAPDANAVVKDLLCKSN